MPYQKVWKLKRTLDHYRRMASKPGRMAGTTARLTRKVNIHNRLSSVNYQESIFISHLLAALKSRIKRLSLEPDQIDHQYRRMILQSAPSPTPLPRAETRAEGS
ncbi:MAG: hypothetical protein ACKOB4_07115, partial [Acidobacteriota bacterium]